ncbi:MAG: GNAT family N-acetyltransferase [Thalassotalea sp.]|nr:GNAT family N-acetyltransferase [Thalassotalea sp.]
MSSELTTSTFTFQRLCNKESVDKKAIKAFYKNERYSAKFKGFDLAYGAFSAGAKSDVNHDESRILDSADTTAQQELALVASVIISQLHQDNTQALLHGLVTASSARGKGIASRLISFAIRDIKKRESSPSIVGINSIVCFSDPKLANFYLGNQFTLVNADDQGILTSSIEARLLAYQKYQPNLSVFHISLR